jgi:hypothetical protein
MPRTHFDGRQFVCACGWRSSFPADFIAKYKAKRRSAEVDQQEPAP